MNRFWFFGIDTGKDHKEEMKQKVEKSIKTKPRLRPFVIVALMLALLLLIDITVSHNIQFYAKWIECGQKPLETRGAGYLNSGAIHYVEPSSLPGVHATIEYFCTPLEAEQAGYSANPNYYDFPHLTE